MMMWQLHIESQADRSILFYSRESKSLFLSLLSSTARLGRHISRSTGSNFHEEDARSLAFVAGALTNFSYGTYENTNVVIDHGDVPSFAKLLSSPSDDVHEQVVWALGNVAGDSPECCDIVLDSSL